MMLRKNSITRYHFYMGHPVCISKSLEIMYSRISQKQTWFKQRTIASAPRECFSLKMLPVKQIYQWNRMNVCIFFFCINDVYGVITLKYKNLFFLQVIKYFVKLCGIDSKQNILRKITMNIIYQHL